MYCKCVITSTGNNITKSVYEYHDMTDMFVYQNFFRRKMTTLISCGRNRSRDSIVSYSEISTVRPLMSLTKVVLSSEVVLTFCV